MSQAIHIYEKEFEEVANLLRCECNKNVMEQIIIECATNTGIEESHLKTLLPEKTECEYKHLSCGDSLPTSTGGLLVRALELAQECHHGAANRLIESAFKEFPDFVPEFFETLRLETPFKEGVREAAERNRWDVVLEIGKAFSAVDFNWIWELGWDNLIMKLAIKKGDVALVENLLELDVRASSKCGAWYISDAAEVNDLFLVQLFASRSELYIDGVRENMYRAINKGYDEIADYLFELGKEKEWWTEETFTKGGWISVMNYFQRKME